MLVDSNTSTNESGKWP